MACGGGAKSHSLLASVFRLHPSLYIRDAGGKLSGILFLSYYFLIQMCNFERIRNNILLETGVNEIEPEIDGVRRGMRT
ncbi:hypothetical protein NDU88_003737 [Pleurodeles waltl]|uniref:Uncharacterized protein n=1 Tax=Pleurodeles waltl TaxID=8319 RepID=A0AAV7TQF6_PLEWA|nr:hypothetical protein NDU88_003737 [Pleurodeles waltl]